MEEKPECQAWQDQPRTFGLGGQQRSVDGSPLETIEDGSHYFRYYFHISPAPEKTKVQNELTKSASAYNHKRYCYMKVFDHSLFPCGTGLRYL